MSKRPRMAYPRSLFGLMGESVVGTPLGDRLRETEIWRIWPDVVGAPVAGRAQPLRIINGTLTVAVSSAPWMQELRFMTTMMKEKLNERLGSEVVREIVLKTGRVQLPLTTEEAEPLPPAPLTPEIRERIEAEAAAIMDPETRMAFYELMCATLQRQPNGQ